MNFVKNGPEYWASAGYTITNDVGFQEVKPTKATLGTDIKSGSNNAQWKRQIALHLDATTAYTRSGYELTSIGNYAGTSNGKDYPHPRSTCSGWVLELPSLLIPSSLDIMTNDIALKKLKRKLDNAVGDFNVLVPLGELKDLRGTLASSYGLISRLLTALNSIKHGKIPSGDIVKNAAEAWLTFSFGINPMIADAKDIMKSISKFQQRQNSTIHFIGAHTSDYHNSVKSPVYSPIGGVQVERSAVASHTISYKYTAAVRFSLQSGNNYGLSDHLHFSPTEIIPVLWELLPWSWLIDYVSTTGDFLTDMFQSQAGNTLYVVKNRKYTANFAESIILKKFDTVNYTNLSFRSNPLVGRRFEFSREGAPGIPTRSFRFKTFDEITGDPYLAKKLLNLAAIAASR